MGKPIVRDFTQGKGILKFFPCFIYKWRIT